MQVTSVFLTLDPVFFLIRHTTISQQILLALQEPSVIPAMSSPYVLESVLGLLGVAIIYMACLLRAESKASPTDPLLIHNDDSHSASIPIVKHTDSTDITVVAHSLSDSRYLMGGSLSVIDPWALMGIQKPCESGVLPSANTLHAQLASKLYELQRSEASISEIQGLHHAYLAVLNATALLIRDHQYRQLKQQQQQAPQETATVAREDVRRVVKQLEKDRSAFADQAARMESWGAFLQDDLQASKSRIKELEGRLRQAENQARCAPSWFGAYDEFVEQRCIVGEEQRVGSTDLHDSFLEFLRDSRHPEGEPTHKAFRELLQHLGYEYDQVYVDGTNKRGFRGISLLKPTAHLKLKHESV